MKDSGWQFDKFKLMTIYFYKTGELNGSNCETIPLRSNAILNNENNDKYCFFMSILPHPYPCNNNHPKRVLKFKQFSNEINIQGFAFTNGFKCGDVHKSNELNYLSVKSFELKFYQHQKTWKHIIIPIEVSKNDSVRFIDLAVYRNQYVFIEKLNILIGDHNKNSICRQCLSSYTSENMLMEHKQKSGEDNISTLRTSSESHLHWKILFIKYIIF